MSNHHDARLWCREPNDGRSIVKRRDEGDTCSWSATSTPGLGCLKTISIVSFCNNFIKELLHHSCAPCKRARQRAPHHMRNRSRPCDEISITCGADRPDDKLARLTPFSRAPSSNASPRHACPKQNTIALWARALYTWHFGHFEIAPLCARAHGPLCILQLHLFRYKQLYQLTPLHKKLAGKPNPLINILRCRRHVV